MVGRVVALAARVAVPLAVSVPVAVAVLVPLAVGPGVFVAVAVSLAVAVTEPAGVWLAVAELVPVAAGVSLAPAVAGAVALALGVAVAPGTGEASRVVVTVDVGKSAVGTAVEVGLAQNVGVGGRNSLVAVWLAVALPPGVPLGDGQGLSVYVGDAVARDVIDGWGVSSVNRQRGPISAWWRSGGALGSSATPPDATNTEGPGAKLAGRYKHTPSSSKEGPALPMPQPCSAPAVAITRAVITSHRRHSPCLCHSAFTLTACHSNGELPRSLRPADKVCNDGQVRAAKPSCSLRRLS